MIEMASRKTVLVAVLWVAQGLVDRALASVSGDLSEVARGTHDRLIQSGTHGHDARWTFTSGYTAEQSPHTITYFIHDHGGSDSLSSDQVARIRDAADTWNGAGSSATLTEVASDDDDVVHVHGDSDSGCGSASDGVLGCAEVKFLTSHSNDPYPDGVSHHQLVRNTTSNPLRQELTMITRSDWYAGSDPSAIPSDEFDYQTVATQELGHHLGLDHPDESGGHSSSQTDDSPMNSTLSQGEVNRTLQPIDEEAVRTVHTPLPPAFGMGLAALGGLGTARWIQRRRGGRAAGSGRAGDDHPSVSGT